MTDTFKTLSQTYPAARTLTAAYTVPGSTSTVISTVAACNQGTDTAKIRLSVAVAGAAGEAKQYRWYDVQVLPGDTFSATVGLSLAATDVVRVYSDLGTVSFNLFGVQVTGSGVGSVDYDELTSGPALCQARLVLVSATDNDLYLVPYKGNRIVWGDGAYSVTLTGYSCTITNGGLSASTLYYVYVYDNAGVATLEISATGHTAQSNGDETKTGDATRLLVGMIYTTSGSLFQNESQYANVISYHNRLPLFCAAPGGSATTTSASFEDVATEADNLIEFLTWGYEQGIANTCGMGISGTASSDTNNGRLDVEFGTVALGSGSPVSSVIAVTSNTANEYQNMSGFSEMGLTEGHHVFTIWARAYSGATVTVLVNSFARTYG